jgi:periplasmic copper chaperone A
MLMAHYVQRAHVVFAGGNAARSLESNKQGACMKRLSLVMLVAWSMGAHAQVTVKDAWVRATVPQQVATGAFMQIVSAGEARLVEVRSSVAGVVQIHEMSMQGDVMKMHAVPGVELPAGKPVDLKPGGYHVMLMDLKQPLKAGDTVPLTLVVEGKDKKRETVDVKATVRQLNAAGAAPTKP